MSNVVQLFGSKPKPVEHKPIDVTDLVAHIIEWAQNEGIDCDDAGFIVRVSDLMAQLEIMARDSREYA